MIGKLKAVWAQYRLARMRALCLKMLADKQSGIHEVISNLAVRQARAHVMNWLDSKRILHCRFCPSTEPLRNHGIDKVCEIHFHMMQKDGKLELVKP